MVRRSRRGIATRAPSYGGVGARDSAIGVSHTARKPGHVQQCSHGSATTASPAVSAGQVPWATAILSARRVSAPILNCVWTALVPTWHSGHHPRSDSLSDSVSDKNKADSDRAAILRSVFQIDEDLSVYLRVSGRSGLRPPESWIQRVSGSIQLIQPDFEILRRHLKPGISAKDLLQFDGPLKEIYEIVTPAIERRLSDYRAAFPSSPLLSEITLFGPIELGRLETANTRALAWLMDGKKPHGFGCGVADAVIRAAFPESPTVTTVLASVAEKVVPGGRVDVWVKGTWENERQPRWLLTIEAKIDAIESEGQLAKYREHALKDGAEWLGIYLTPGGDDPDDEEGWKTLSFSKLAAVLAAFCVSEQANDKPGHGFLKLYISGLIKDVLGHSLPIDSAGEDPLRSASMIRNCGASLG